MAQFKAFENNAEVNGQTVLSIVDGMGTYRETALAILKENGIDSPRKDRWYSQQSWLNAFKKISDSIGKATLFSIGKRMPENAEFPPYVNDLQKALAAIDVAYHMNHRINGTVMFDPGTGKMLEGIGHYKLDRIDDKTYKMVCKNPYPSEFDRGIIDAMANRFKPEGIPRIHIETFMTVSIPGTYLSGPIHILFQYVKKIKCVKHIRRNATTGLQREGTGEKTG